MCRRSPDIIRHDTDDDDDDLDDEAERLGFLLEEDGNVEMKTERMTHLPPQSHDDIMIISIHTVTIVHTAYAHMSRRWTVTLVHGVPFAVRIVAPTAPELAAATDVLRMYTSARAEGTCRPCR